jgi:hypothetical protein
MSQSFVFSLDFMIVFLVILLLAGGSAAAAEPEPAPVVQVIPAETLAAWKPNGAATLEAGVISIVYDGKAVAQFTNIRPTECAGNNTCSIWRFDRLIRAFDRPSGKVKNLALLDWFSGESPVGSVLVESDGALIFFERDDPVLSGKKNPKKPKNVTDAAIDFSVKSEPEIGYRKLTKP